MKHLSTFLAAGCALALSVPAAAQFNRSRPAPPADAPNSMQQLDSNRDGTISPAEAGANPALSDQFLMLDTNGDGALEPAEFSRFEAMGAGTTRGTPGSPGSSTPGIAPGTVTPPPPMGSTPPPMGSTPPPMGSTPPPNTSTPPPTTTTTPPQ